MEIFFFFPPGWCIVASECIQDQHMETKTRKVIALLEAITPLCHCFIQNSDDSDTKQILFLMSHELTILPPAWLLRPFLWCPVFQFSCQAFSLSYGRFRFVDSTFLELNTSFLFCFFFNHGTAAHIFSVWLFVYPSVLTGTLLHVILTAFHTIVAGSVPSWINVSFSCWINGLLIFI